MIKSQKLVAFAVGMLQLLDENPDYRDASIKDELKSLVTRAEENPGIELMDIMEPVDDEVLTVVLMTAGFTLTHSPIEMDREMCIRQGRDFVITLLEILKDEEGA